MITELTTHTFIEETIFYPAARREVPDTVARGPSAARPICRCRRSDGMSRE
jgi:hypothetical protein